MIKFIRQNIFNTSCEIIGHGVNCRGGFGSGLAGQIAKRCPEIRDAYLRKFQRSGWNLGDIQIIKIKNEIYEEKFKTKYLRNEFKYIANIATQYDFGGNVVHANYTAIREGLDKLFGWAKDNNYRVAVPLIGSGLAGGDWNTVYKIIRELVQKHEIDVEIYYL